MADAKVTWVQVVDGQGNVLPDEVPSHWLDTSLLPPGVKKATAANIKAAQTAKAAADSGVDVSAIRAEVEASVMAEVDALRKENEDLKAAAAAAKS